MPEGNYERSDISMGKDEATEQKILEMCDEYGVCVIDSFLSEDELSSIKEEYDKLYDEREKLDGVHQHSKTEYIHNLNIDYGDLDKSSFPAITQLVSDSMFENITRRYYDEEDVLYPANLWTARTKGTPDSPDGTPSDDSPYAFHLDTTNKFKFFFYISDVELEDGPTYFVPEYHEEYKEQRLEWLEKHGNTDDMPNVIWHYDVSGQAEEKAVPIVGDAGTLIIFDTDTPHRAGDLKEGREREIMRIDTLSPTHSFGEEAERDTEAKGLSSKQVVKGVRSPKKAAKFLYRKTVQ